MSLEALSSSPLAPLAPTTDSAAPPDVNLLAATATPDALRAFVAAHPEQYPQLENALVAQQRFGDLFDLANAFPVLSGRLRIGTPAPLNDADFQRAAATLGVDEATIRAVSDVESRGAGFLPDGRAKILFEAHKFSAFTGHKYDATNPDISSKKWNPALYGKGGAHQYDRLDTARTLDDDAALRAASWGRFQIMGFNYAAAGYADVGSFVSGMNESEGRQLDAFVAFIQHEKLDGYLRSQDWAGFAEHYNGPGYAANQYDTKLADAYARYTK